MNYSAPLGMTKWCVIAFCRRQVVIYKQEVKIKVEVKVKNARMLY